MRERLGGDDRHSDLLEDRGCSHEEAQQEAQAWGQRGRPRAPGRVDGGGLDLRIEEGREGDVGDQRGAGIVDEGIDLLGLLTAGFDLENTREHAEHSYPLISFKMHSGFIIGWKSSSHCHLPFMMNCI